MRASAFFKTNGEVGLISGGVSFPFFFFFYVASQLGRHSLFGPLFSARGGLVRLLRRGRILHIVRRGTSDWSD